MADENQAVSRAEAIARARSEAVSRAKAIATAEAESRKQGAKNDADEDPMSGWDRASSAVGSAVDSAGRLAGSFNRGFWSPFLPKVAEDALEKAGAFNDYETEPTPLEAGFEYAGQALPYVWALPLAAGRFSALKAGELMGSSGLFRTMAQNLSKFAATRPGAYYAGEGAAALFAGASRQKAKDKGSGPVGQLAAEMAGGVAGGGLTAIPSSIRGIKQAVLSNLAPMTNEGGTIRAARQIQSRAGGRGRATVLADNLQQGDIGDGVTPAQFLGEERLIAQERRILEDSPEISAKVKENRLSAYQEAQEELRDKFGNPRTRRQWEMSIIERVSPEGAKVRGLQTDEMLNSAYRAFEPLYDKVRGIDVSTEGLKKNILNSVRSEDIISGPEERRNVLSYLNGRWRAYDGKLGGNIKTTDDLLDMRTDIRSETRKQERSASAQSLERAELLRAAESRITEAINISLPKDLQKSLSRTDNQHRKYKAVERAIFNAGDSQLSPDQISESIRAGITSPSKYARGVDPQAQELRALSVSGQNIEDIFGDPRRAALVVRGLDETGRRAVKADFMNALFNRAKTGATESTDAGISFISGKKLQSDILENKAVMRSLGISKPEIDRIEAISQQILQLSRKQPAAVADLFEDGPASLMQLAAALVGAHSGQSISGGGIGSGLVMAQFMSTRARRLLSRLTSDQAAKIMNRAVTDRSLYRSLLVKDVTPINTQKEMAQYLDGWILANLSDGEEE